MPESLSRNLREQVNLYRAHLWAINFVRENAGPNFTFLPGHLTDLHKVITDGVLPEKEAGHFRRRDVRITDTSHVPPAHAKVPRLVEELCRTINSRWTRTGVPMIGAYGLWAVNWVHPFIDGNGRTAREIAYTLMCLRAGGPFRGERTIIQQLEERRAEYIETLQLADEGYRRNGHPDLKNLERLLTSMLIEQLKE